MESLKGSLMAMSELFSKRMDEFQQQLQRNSPNPSTTSSIAADFSAFRKFIIAALETIQRQVEFLGNEIERLEMRGRRKIVLLHGIAEEKSEDTTSVATSIISSKLQLADFTKASISRSHRLGRPSENRPRPLLIKFREVATRNRIWFTKTKLKGSGITLSEFLTKSRHRVFTEARACYGITNCWTRDGCIYILAADGSHHQVQSLAELDAVPVAPAVPSPVQPNKGKATDPKAVQRSKRTIRKY